MQSSTNPADRAGTIGVEAFDATYGAGFQASDDSPHAVECELVEDGGAFVAHRPSAADRPRRVAFVDGTLRTEARLTRTSADGDVSMGLAGSWAAGAVLVQGDEPARFDQVTTGRAAIFTGGRPVRLPDHRDGWRWQPYAVDGSDVVDAARQQLQRLMRDGKAVRACSSAQAARRADAQENPMRYLVWCTGLVALVAASGTAAIQAQSRSRADLQLGGWWHDRRPGVVMGATGWLNDNSGVAVRGVVGSLRSGHHLKGFEVMYRHRGFVGDFEIDFGVGSVLLRGHGWTRLNGIIEEVVEWAPVPAMDILVGHRFNERIGVKAGAGCHFLLGGGEDIPIWSVVKFMVVVPLGSL